MSKNKKPKPHQSARYKNWRVEYDPAFSEAKPYNVFKDGECICMLPTMEDVAMYISPEKKIKFTDWK